MNYAPFFSLVSLFVEFELAWFVVRINEMYSRHQHNAKWVMMSSIAPQNTVLISVFWA